jgi:hypothetical protein
MSTHNNIPEPNSKVDFQVPEGYFDSLTGRIQDRMNISVEVVEISDDALLPIATDNNFSVPAQYFEQLENSVVNRATSQVALQRETIVRKLVGWTVAASVVLAAFFFIPKQTSSNTTSTFELALAQTDLEMDEFISVLSNEELEQLFMEEVNNVEVAELEIAPEEEPTEVMEEEISEEIKPSVIDEALMKEEISEEDMYDYILDEDFDYIYE